MRAAARTAVGMAGGAAEPGDKPGLARPWAKPALEECNFYHSMDLPQTGPVTGEWDIRPDFDNYVGGIKVEGRSVLDVGTCTGGIAFELERRGARVTAYDLGAPSGYVWVPFAETLYHQDRRQWNRLNGEGLRRYKNAFWYAWHEFGSKAEVVYGNINLLWQLAPEHDIVMAGAIIEHLSDPVTAIGHMARLARETLVIGFTPVEMTEEVLMRPLIPWSPDYPYVWWKLSLGLYRQLLTQLGFEIEVRPAWAVFHGQRGDRHTIVARRVRGP